MSLLSLPLEIIDIIAIILPIKYANRLRQCCKLLANIIDIDRIINKKIVIVSESFYYKAYLSENHYRVVSMLEDTRHGVCEEYYYKEQNILHSYRISNYFNNKLNGESITYYPNGTILWHNYYTHDKEHGTSNHYDENGVWRSSTTYDNGNYICQRQKIICNRPNGNTITTDAYDYIVNNVGFKHIIRYYNGIKCKDSVCCYGNKDKPQTTSTIQFYPNGNIEYIKRPGYIRRYYDNNINSLKCITYYKGGRKHGPYQEYNERKQLIYDILYESDNMIMRKYIDYTDQGYFSKIYTENIPNNSAIKTLYYYNTNIIYNITRYKNGIKSGEYVVYNADGRINVKFIYRDNRIIKEYEYDRSGKCIMVIKLTT